MRVAINGFGRIGRTILRQVLCDPVNADIEVALINEIAPLGTCAYLFQYDSVFGPFPGAVSLQGDMLVAGDAEVRMTQADDLSTVDLGDIDLVLECTGRANSRDIAERGLRAGAGSVLISGPSAAAEVTLVLGANEELLGSQSVISNASCTTNALAPILRLIDDTLGIERGHMTTIHCYTGSQPMVDAPRASLPRSRAGAVSMIPTTTSATKLVGQVLPQLDGRISGAAVRVPAISVSAIDLTLQLREQPGTAMNQFLSEAVKNRTMIGLTDDPVVSTDMRGRPESLIIATPETMELDGGQVRLFGWYDNEWGYSARVLDMARLIHQRI
ncbi:MAG: glyceraldehyde 3-phosphate dehydrogenase NAD-binding domain-containing protein [Pseudomonadota bacterium]